MPYKDHEKQLAAKRAYARSAKGKAVQARQNSKPSKRIAVLIAKGCPKDHAIELILGPSEPDP